MSFEFDGFKENIGIGIGRACNPIPELGAFTSQPAALPAILPFLGSISIAVARCHALFEKPLACSMHMTSYAVQLSSSS
jgi:hypothetical protein